MNWILLSLLSAIFIGGYDLCTKHAVRGNAVLPVLFLGNLCSASIWIALLLLQRANPGLLPDIFSVPALDAHQHALLALKSFIVSGAWLCTYFAVKHLPVSLAVPVRATAPLWTLAGAAVVLAERPSLQQTAGIFVTLTSLVLLSIAGRNEGVHFHRDKWIGWLFLGTILNSISALYDKYLLGQVGFTASTVQAWFSIYLATFFLPVAIMWKWRLWQRQEFHWRWSIPLNSLMLLTADFLYFTALHHPRALVSVVSCLRGGGALVSFTGGLMLFHEQGNKRKFAAVFGILSGIALIILGRNAK